MSFVDNVKICQLIKKLSSHDSNIEGYRSTNLHKLNGLLNVFHRQ